MPPTAPSSWAAPARWATPATSAGSSPSCAPSRLPTSTAPPSSSTAAPTPGCDDEPLIRLDAATVLLQWATGGLLFLWVTTRRREVGIGYGWLLRGTYLVLALGAVAAGRLTGKTVVVRDIS